MATSCGYWLIATDAAQNAHPDKARTSRPSETDPPPRRKTRIGACARVRARTRTHLGSHARTPYDVVCCYNKVNPCAEESRIWVSF